MWMFGELIISNRRLVSAQDLEMYRRDAKRLLRQIPGRDGKLIPGKPTGEETEYANRILALQGPVCEIYPDGKWTLANVADLKPL